MDFSYQALTVVTALPLKGDLISHQAVPGETRKSSECFGVFYSSLKLRGPDIEMLRTLTLLDLTVSLHDNGQAASPLV